MKTAKRVMAPITTRVFTKRKFFSLIPSLDLLKTIILKFAKFKAKVENQSPMAVLLSSNEEQSMKPTLLMRMHVANPEPFQ